MNLISKFRKVFFVLIIAIFFLNFSVSATSLWDDGNADLYKSEEKEYELGDVVTVIIEESSDAIQSANTSLSQDSNVDAGAGLGIFDFLRSFGFTYSDQDNSDGQTGRSGSIRADITTMIVDIYDNGNLKIEGSKTIKINGEEQIIRLAGIIRPEDISEENTIPSPKLADASIEFDGKGVVADKQKPNIFQRFLNWIF